MWNIIAPIVGSAIGGLIGGKGDPASEYFGAWGKDARQVMSAGSEIHGQGRQPLNTPWGPIDYETAAGLGFGNMVGGMRAHNALTDPNLMLDVVNNPYVMGAANAAANDAQRRTAANAFGNGNFGGGAHMRAAAGAIADSTNRVMNQAYQQGLTGLARGMSMTPQMTMLPGAHMEDFQQKDFRFLQPHADNVAMLSPGTAGQPGDRVAGAIGGAGIGKGIWDWGKGEGIWGTGGSGTGASIFGSGFDFHSPWG